MKVHKILLLFMLLLIVTGCKLENLSNDSIDKNIDIILNKKIKYANKNAVGYQYYLPSGVSVNEVNDFNQILFSNGNHYYLYADVVSYYHKVKKNYKVNKKAFYSKELKYGKNYGYIEINEDSGKYYIEMMYNYAKIESYVKKEDINDTVINMSYILSSVKYNDDIIEILLGESKYDLSNDETYNIFDTKKEDFTNNFLDYVNEYDNYDGEIKNLIEQEEIETKNDN